MSQYIIKIQYKSEIKVFDGIMNAEIMNMCERDNKQYSLVGYKFTPNLLIGLISDEVSKPSLRQRKELYNNKWVLM